MLVSLVGLSAATQLFDGLPSSLDPAASSEAERIEARLIELTGTDGHVAVLVDGDPNNPTGKDASTATATAIGDTTGVRSVADHSSRRSGTHRGFSGGRRRARRHR